MKKFLVIISLLFILFGCVNFNEIPTNSEISNLSSDETSYIASVVIDDETQNFIAELSEIIAPKSTTEMHTFSTEEEQMEDIIENILELIEEHPNLIEKFKKILETTNKIREKEDRLDFKVVFKKEAREKILNAFNIETDKEIAMDYRDVVILHTFTTYIVKTYEKRERIRNYVKSVKNAKMGKIDTFLTSQASNLISNTSFAEPNTQEFWTTLKDLGYQLSEISEDKDILDMKDLFTETLFKIPGIKEEIKIAKTILDSAIELYNFEKTKTNEKGWTNWYSFFELFALKFGATEDSDIRIGKELDEKIDTENTDIKINGTQINNKAYIDILKELNHSLDSKLVIEASQTTFSATLTIDFKNLPDPIDLRDNNLGIKKSFFDSLLEQKIWNYWGTEESLYILLNSLLNNTTFTTFSDESIQITIKGLNNALKIDAILKLY
ncbi:hypothetical protein BG95_04750 [Thermosipho sp. 1063]|uniref:hypothetical protein n=1 Tax=unclassified Thermosipho (in: thermotogales) TaxID=2676525 RepID=UPI0009493FE1|nr:MULTISPECIES: hypothetical protein [unclassified Thermosipho (in: thermotogales)]ANQ54626.1 hypothetical protein Y592_04820 [Thermosipho sp. 1070]APT73040.1 hypothetical protein BG95_04750 [Thermosipho sp. 1063]OOC43440.1 hypothetical protein XO08_04640 [Thermosipho sp. 1074]